MCAKTRIVKLSEIDLNLLVVLDAIIRERSVTRAGRRIGLSQPATSAALRRLRDIFTDPLLERVGRDHHLTPLALELAEPLQQILLSIERTIDRKGGFDHTTAQRSYQIAGSDYMQCVIIQPLLRHLVEAAPGIKLLVQRADGTTGRHLAARHIDLSLQPAGSHRSFVHEQLFIDHWVCIVWSGNTEVSTRITREQLCRLGHVVYSHAPYGFTLADRYLANVANELQIRVMCDNFLALTTLLQGTNLVAFAQSRLVERLKASADIRVVEAPIPTGELSVCMWWNSLYNTDPAHTWLRETIAMVARGLDEAPKLRRAVASDT